MTTMPHEMTKKLIFSATGQKLIGGGKTLCISVLRKQSTHSRQPRFQGHIHTDFTFFGRFLPVFRHKMPDF